MCLYSRSKYRRSRKTFNFMIFMIFVKKAQYLSTGQHVATIQWHFSEPINGLFEYSESLILFLWRCQIFRSIESEKYTKMVPRKSSVRSVIFLVRGSGFSGPSSLNSRLYKIKYRTILAFSILITQTRWISVVIRYLWLWWVVARIGWRFDVIFVSE